MHLLPNADSLESSGVQSNTIQLLFIDKCTSYVVTMCARNHQLRECGYVAKKKKKKNCLIMLGVGGN